MIGGVSFEDNNHEVDPFTNAGNCASMYPENKFPFQLPSL
jgi:hypothetical protein